MKKGQNRTKAKRPSKLGLERRQMTPARRQKRVLRPPRPMSQERKSEPKERLGLSNFAGEEDRKKQASGTRAPTEPEDVDPASSPNISKNAAHHSEKRRLQGGPIVSCLW
jgi:hypothetical protein